MAEQSIAEQLRNDSDDPYFMVAPENNGDDLKWLQRNWALREAAAIYIDRLTKERDAAVLAEREAIAKWHDKMAAHYRDLADTNGAFEHRYRWHEHCKSADAIRARSNTDTGPQAQVRAEAGASAATDDADAKLLAAFDAVRAEIIDSSLCDASEGLSSLVFSQLSDFRLRLHEYFIHRLAASPTPPAAEAVGGDVDVREWVDKRAELLAWTGSAILSGEAPFTSDARGDLYSFLCSLIGYFHAGEELQRERVSVSGQDGVSSTALGKGTGPAATLPMPPYSYQAEGGTSSVSTASDDVVEEIGRSMDVQYAIGAIINNEGTFFDGRGESMDRLVRAILSSPPIVKIRDALDHIHMHAFQAGDLMMMPRIEYLAADIDGVLSRFQSVGGEKQDHADGTSAEAVEKVTQPG